MAKTANCGFTSKQAERESFEETPAKCLKGREYGSALPSYDPAGVSWFVNERFFDASVDTYVQSRDNGVWPRTSHQEKQPRHTHATHAEAENDQPRSGGKIWCEFLPSRLAARPPSSSQ